MVYQLCRNAHRGPNMREDKRMSYRGNVLLLLLVAVHSLPVLAQSKYDLKRCDSAPAVEWTEAAARAVVRAPVEIPPLAKAVRTRGVVRIEMCISEDGLVVLTKPVSGHPLLIPAAIESAKNWRFANSQPGPYKTIANFSFTDGATPAEVAADEKINGRYFEEERKCRDMYHRKDYDQALVICKGAIEWVEKLPKERMNERRLAYEIVGHVYLSDRRFDEALQNYKTELQIALSSLKPYEAELAYAYHDIALALHAMGQVKDAAQFYGKAEDTMVQARDRIGLEELKPRYSATLKQIREHYLVLLHQTGADALASALEKRIREDRQ
jgi:tetratricopeptide (TPR) repeat protein